LRSVIDGVAANAEVFPALPGPYPAVCRDPNDDYIVASALAGRADLVVTLDDDLLALAEHAGVRFVKPGGALAILREAGLLPPA
jgi:predicted nucleic acid-binding protein